MLYGMGNVRGVLARVFVDDLDAALPLYQELTGADEVRRFEFRGVQVARVGSFLLFSGDTDQYRDRVATILVADMGPVVAAIEASGGSLLEGPAPAPNGDRLIARHADGSVFEYIETGA
jgi:catechol 2,3-dioxygenase-like lactoylglutathione lyase family enzyme